MTVSGLLPSSLLGGLLAITGIIFFRRPAWFPVSITASGKQYDRQFLLTLFLSGLIFFLAHLLLIFALARSGRRALPRRLETACFFVSTFLFAGLAFTGTRIWAGVHPQPIPSDAEHIDVLAHQFAWNFHYAGPDGQFGRTSLLLVNDAAENPFGLDPKDPASADDIVTATLKVPAGRDVVLTLRARDVIHDFFVRELRLKQDAVPGMDIPYRFRAETPGTYEIACSELCGLGHSQMRSTMEVMAADAYERWKRLPR